MTVYGYSTQLQGEHTACASGRDLGMSTKASVEICRWIRYRNLQKAKNLLQLVLEKKLAVPYLKFIQDVGHKPGIRSGRYPVKAVKEILTLLESVEKNAVFKNLNVDNLKIVHINAHKASTPMQQGRHGGRVMKRTHVEIVVAEEKSAKNEINKKKESITKIKSETHKKQKTKQNIKNESKTKEAKE